MSRPALAVRLSLALDRFDLEVELTTTGHVTGVFGPSGAGKTSLLRSIAGLKRRARGEIRLGEEVWLDSSRRVYVAPEKRGIGYVPQDGLLFPHKSVQGNLLAGAARARRQEGGSPESTFRTVCDLLELEPLLRRDVATLSGGERQRVALGRAICSGPRLLLLDEPLASLDLPLRRRVLPFLRRIRDEFDVPMILVTHDPREIQALCDEVAVLRDGKIVTRGPPRRILTDPEVFFATREGFENVLPGTVVSNGDSLSEVRLGAGVCLTTPRVAGLPGSEVLLGIPAHEIILATQEPVRLSAQNILPATVTGVEAIEDLHLVTATLAAGVPEVVVEVTDRAVSELELAPGRPVFFIIKARSCVPYGGTSSAAELLSEGSETPSGDSPRPARPNGPSTRCRSPAPRS